MTTLSGGQPAIVLVDDDYHSARLMLRMLATEGGPAAVHWMAEQDRAARELLAICAEARPGRPLVVVDLKSSSTATADFIARLRADCPALLIVAMAPSLDRDAREHLLHTGAAAVFERHSDIDLYRNEVRSIVSFWMRHQTLNSVGA